jgi:hypothetical protein
MSDLIKALQILLKYGDPWAPTFCSHDKLTICSVDASRVSAEDNAALRALGFHVNEFDDCFESYRFGSA